MHYRASNQLKLTIHGAVGNIKISSTFILLKNSLAVHEVHVNEYTVGK